ncbi:hypothetical protein [Gemmobacter denitrificans]|uniref:Uncharacterized protein n=1 Tax=Gemmobacter denitrificans TaxID=3123040 RepID=A0ABU8BPB3_9RHOB
MELGEADPKGLVRESYNIDGISDAECRSIFIDWALSLRMGVDSRPALAALIAHYGPGCDSHPMTLVLRAALDAPPEPKRRGGRAGRMTG